MKKIIYLIAIIVTFINAFACAQKKQDQPSDYRSKNWKEVATKMPFEWYGTNEAKMVADSVLKYQTEIGGWPKNSDFHNGSVKQKEWQRIKSTGIGATFDNGATITEIKFLAKIYAQQKEKRYRESFMKAFNYIFEAQYANGGWPQFFPFRKGKSVAYASHITYNDDAMVNTMNFLKEIFNGEKMYEPLQVGDENKIRAKKAFDKGIECILKTQIVVDGELTVWCAQHDEFTFAPANARSYELASFSGSESVVIVELLMKIKNPSVEIVAAVNGAIEWFENHKIEGVKIVSEIDKNGNKNRIVVEDASAKPLWGRFYDLETGKPFFCDRDGIKKNTLAEIGYNRRNGYGWYTDKPAKVLQKYPEWKNNLNLK